MQSLVRNVLYRKCKPYTKVVACGIFTDYGRPMKTPFFHWYPELLCSGIKIEQINSGAYGLFSAKLSAPILVQWVPCPCFPLFNHYFLQKKTKPSLISTSQIFISDWDLNLSRKELGIYCVRSSWVFPPPSIQFPPEKDKVLKVAKSQNIFSCPSLHFQRKELNTGYYFENITFLPASILWPQMDLIWNKCGQQS